MPATFSRTLRSLKADSSRPRTVAVAAALLLLGAWAAWFLLGRVAVYEVTDRARLEVEIAAHPVEARVEGQVVETKLTLGREVRRGEVLVELDAETEKLALDQARTRLEGFRARLEALRAEIRSAKEAAAAHEKAGAVAVQESRARIAAAEASAELAESKAKSEEALHRDGSTSDEALREAKADAKSKRATAQALGLSTTLLGETLTAQRLDRESEIAKLESERVDIEGKMSEEEDQIRRLEREVGLRQIFAPIDGRIGHAIELRVGMVVRAAQELGSVVPAGKPRAVAFFPPAAVGRIRPQQPARLRLDGFPWTQFGTPLATVTDVGTEPTEGRVRVELSLDLESAPAIPLEHGLTGSVEVEVERISPAEVVLRAAGRLLSPRGTPESGGAGGAHAGGAHAGGAKDG
jgi:membrane fusion protein (multidrug efflux system)